MTDGQMGQHLSHIPQQVGKLAALLNRLVHFTASHWLLIVNAVMAVQATLPALPPVLMLAGWHSAARFMYSLFQPLCHQLPERSFFLFGPQLTYQFEELQSLVGPNVPLRFIGSPTTGYKLAVCQRDLATYASILVAGLAFTLLRQRLKPLSLKAFGLLCMPMAIDGFGQLFGMWESTWWSRVLSGGLFGIACVWLAYPYVESGMKDVLKVTAPTEPEP